MQKRVLIVGAGPGGLALAMLLAKAGLDVKIIERMPRVGGRTSTIEAHSFRFDIGPAIFTLPRAFRRAGFMTDLVDATDIAACRMYRSWPEVWSGLAKNAGEGLAAPTTLVPATLLLLGGQVLPVICLLGARPATWIGLAVAGVGVTAAYCPRWQARCRFRQSGLGMWLHPIDLILLLSIRWYAFICARLGRPQQWKRRA